MFQATRPHHRVPRLPARPTSKAPTTPRPSSKTARRCSRRSPRASASTCRELRPCGPHHAAAGALHRGEPGEGARGARHRPAVHVRVGHRHDPRRARLRVEEGHRARPDVDRVREGAAARALLRAPHRLRLHRHDGGGARRGRARRGRSREVARTPSTSATAQAGCASSCPRSTSRRSTWPRSTRCTSASTPTGRELIVRVWPNGASIERGDEKAPIPADLAPDELTLERAEELLAKGSRRPARARRRSRDRDDGARAHRPLRSVRAARRARGGLEGEAEARVAVRVDGPRHGHARGGARSCCRCRASSAPTPTATRSPRRTVATGRT